MCAAHKLLLYSCQAGGPCLHTVVAPSQPVQPLGGGKHNPGPPAVCFALQATIYDDMHMGGHVAIVGNLALSSTPEASKVCAPAVSSWAGVSRPCTHLRSVRSSPNSSAARVNGTMQHQAVAAQSRWYVQQLS